MVATEPGDATGDRPRYPVGRPVTTPPPSAAPVYDHPPHKQSAQRTWTLAQAVDGAFFVVGALLVFWLGWVLLVRDVRSGWELGLAVVVFWLLLAYVGLPRLQEVLAHVFVPDYFIGRTVTGTGALGDPVNLALNGDEARLHAAMERAGWVRADEVTLASSWRIIVSSVLRRSYPSAPVSPLLLFGRSEAFAYEQEVDGNASQRHHVRFWPVPEGWSLPGGYRVEWLAAATYDRAVGLSLFTLQVTHKVDADVDVERDYVVDTVRFANPAARLSIVDDFSTAFRTRNGGGDVVHTDGDLPVLDLAEVDAGAEVAPAPDHGLTSHHLPPPALLVVGAMAVAKGALTLASLVASGVGLSDSSPIDDLSELGVVNLLTGSVVVGVLWLLVLARRRWARTLLMAVCAYEAVAQTAELARDAHPSLVVLASTSISVLILIAVSSTEAGRWVDRSRVPAARLR